MSNKSRLVILILIIFLLFSILIAQFFRIQILEGSKWTKEANKQHYMIVKEPFHRGRFFSNASIKKGHPEVPQSFVVDIQKYHLFVDPLSIPERYRESISNQLLMMLNIPEEEQKTFKEQFHIKSRNRKLAMWLDKETNDALFDWWIPFSRRYRIPRNALYTVKDYQRSYPFGKLCGQLLHTIRSQKDETTKQAVPTGGLELQFNNLLKGKEGKRVLMRSPRHSFATGKVIAYPQHGADIYLTINPCLQAIAEEELEKGVKKSKGKGGWVIMLEPNSGEILALAQYPFFYPPNYQKYFNDPALINNTQVRAATDAHEPGSVLKPIILTMALQANDILTYRGEKPLFDPDAKMATSSGFFPGRTKELTDTRLHYYLNMEMALQKSSNIYFARLTEWMITRLGGNWFRHQLKEVFGIGEKTEIELPSESSGLLPNPYRHYPNGVPQWTGSTPYSIAIGHNVQLNALQIARAYAIFANGGYSVKPTLIRKITKNNEVILDNTQNYQRKLVVNPIIVKKVVNAMKYTTKEGGTARRAGVPGYSEAGKTGTAEKILNGTYSKQHYCSSFVGFTPVNQPAFVLLVVIDEPEYGFIPGVGKNHHGGTCAAPIFREIATRSLEYLGIVPDDPYGYFVGDPRFDESKADWIKEVKALAEKYNQWNQ